MNLKEIKREIATMGINREWSDTLLASINAVRNYPQYLTYSINSELHHAAMSLGADMWRDTLHTVVNNLKKLTPPDVFLNEYSKQIYGVQDWDVARYNVFESYSEIYSKFHVNNSAPFAYRLAQHQTLKVILFEKISDLEIIEYVISHPIHGTRGTSRTTGLGVSAGFLSVDDSGISDRDNWGYSPSIKNSLQWKRDSEHTLFGNTPTGADF